MAEISISEFADKTKRKMDAVVRSFVLEIGSTLVQESPVGDPKKWSAEFVTAATKLGWIGEGYVGGRFKGNWQYGFRAAPDGDLETIDKSGDASNARIEIGVHSSPAAGVHYLVNNLPYAQALEDGHSGQAPTGVVSLTMIEAPQILREIATNANKS